MSLFSAVRMIYRRPAFRFAWQMEIFLPLAAIAALFAFGFARMNGQNPPGATLRITLVQPSIPQALIWDRNANANRFRQLIQLTENALASSPDNTNSNEPLAPSLYPPGGERVTGLSAVASAKAEGQERSSSKTDLLIWPESAVPEFDETSFIAITNLIRTHHLWLIFNADDARWRPNAKNKDDFDVFNAAFLFNPEGRCAAVYHKQNLVIFGEYIPLVRWLPFVKWFTPITGSFASGTNAVPFEMDFGVRRHVGALESGDMSPHSKDDAPFRVKTATLICFEDVFPELTRKYAQDDTDFLVNLTNDGWFGDSAAQWQQAAAAVFRAVENGVPLVRSSNNGLTCWVDASGRLREIFRDKTGSVYGVGAMTVEIPVGVKREPIFYNRHGDWFGWLCVGVTGILFVVKISGQRRRIQP